MKPQSRYAQSGWFAVALIVVTVATNASDRDPLPGTIEFDQKYLEIELIANSTHPITMVDAGGAERYKFVVDTGASVNVIDSNIARSLGLEVVGETKIGAPGGNKIEADIVLVPEVRVADGYIRNAEFVVMDIDGMTRGLMQGVVGLPVFSDYLLTFDQGNERILVSRESLAADSKAVIPFQDVGGHIQVDMQVVGETVATHVDTGSMAAFTLPIELKERLAIKDEAVFRSGARLVGGTRNIERAQLDGDIILAGNRYEDPTVGFMDPSPGYGNVGSRVLRDYQVAIDQKNQLIRFLRNEEQRSEERAPRRLGIEFRGMPDGGSLSVARVIPGSLGEQAGLLPGDSLTAVNGVSMDELEIQILGPLFGGHEPLVLDVDRDGEAITIRIP